MSRPQLILTLREDGGLDIAASGGITMGSRFEIYGMLGLAHEIVINYAPAPRLGKPSLTPAGSALDPNGKQET